MGAVALYNGGDKVNPELGSWIRHREHHVAYRERSNSKFLAKFALSGIEVRLTQLELSTGEFPQAAVALVNRPFADKVGRVALGDGGDDGGGHGKNLGTQW